MHKYAGRLFYGVVLAVALAGSSQAASGWLGWWIGFAIIAVGVVELGAVVLSVHADQRRMLGERAIPARLLSASLAAGAVAGNYFGHYSIGQSVFFAGVSAFGYAYYLIQSSARRRDALRKAGKLEGTAPVYGIFAWMRHPALTLRARGLALATPELGKLGSLAEARAWLRAERRVAAIETALRRRIADHVDPTMAAIAVNTYDMDEVARRLAAGADYAGLTALLADELLPARLHAPTTPIVAELPAQADAAPVRDAPVAPMPAIEPVARPVRTRRPRAQWDAHEVVRMILAGERMDATIRKTGASPASAGRIARVIRILQNDPNAMIGKEEKVTDETVQFIRSQVAR